MIGAAPSTPPKEKIQRQKASGHGLRITNMTQFNFSNAVAQIKTLHSKIVDLDRSSLKLAIQIGEQLVSIKNALKSKKSDKKAKKVQKGERWMGWCEENLTFNHRTVTNYINEAAAVVGGMRQRRLAPPPVTAAPPRSRPSPAPWPPPCSSRP